MGIIISLDVAIVEEAIGTQVEDTVDQIIGTRERIIIIREKDKMKSLNISLYCSKKEKPII